MKATLIIIAIFAGNFASAAMEYIPENMENSYRSALSLALTPELNGCNAKADTEAVRNRNLSYFSLESLMKSAVNNNLYIDKKVAAKPAFAVVHDQSYGRLVYSINLNDGATQIESVKFEIQKQLPVNYGNLKSPNVKWEWQAQYTSECKAKK